MTFTNNLKGYSLEFVSSAKKSLKAIDRKDAAQISDKLDDLVAGAQGLDVLKLHGSVDRYRLRWGKYRVIFTIEEYRITVLILEVAHRREAYRD